MIFVGFGFLMTFLKKYGFSSVGYNFLISCIAVQWAMINNGFWHTVGTKMNNDWHGWKTIELDLTSLITGDFAAGAVLITFGAVLGKTTPLQMLIVVILELIVYALNETIGAYHLSAVDMGGSIFVHTFGAYFGLALSWVITRPRYNTGKVYDPRQPEGAVMTRALNGSDKTSDMFAMIGTLFLWMFWPSFNGALASGDQQVRVVINTVLALSACCVAAFAAISLLRPDRKFDMVSIQNATLAGGVAVGSSSDLVIQPGGAIVVGLVAGIVSVFGYEYVQPYLARRFGLHDTCGVHNLHGMPGIIGALGGAISAAQASSTVYGESIGRVFPMRATDNATLAAIQGVSVGENRSAAEQAAVQVYALLITLGFSLAGGALTGFVIKMPCLLPGREDQKAPWCKIGASIDDSLWYNDEHHWEVPEEDEELDEAERQELLVAERRKVEVEIEMLAKKKEMLTGQIAGSEEVEVEVEAGASKDAAANDSTQDE